MKLKNIYKLGFVIKEVVLDTVVVNYIDMDNDVSTLDDIINFNYDIDLEDIHYEVATTVFEITHNGKLIKSEINEQQVVEFFQKEYLKYLK